MRATPLLPSAVLIRRCATPVIRPLFDTTSGFGKAYLNLLVDEMRLDGNELLAVR